jgi:hypothetical protein
MAGFVPNSYTRRRRHPIPHTQMSHLQHKYRLNVMASGYRRQLLPTKSQNFFKLHLSNLSDCHLTAHCHRSFQLVANFVNECLELRSIDVAGVLCENLQTIHDWCKIRIRKTDYVTTLTQRTHTHTQRTYARMHCAHTKRTYVQRDE